MSYGPPDWAYLLMFILAVIGALAVVGGAIWLIVWLIMHVRFA